MTLLPEPLPSGAEAGASLLAAMAGRTLLLAKVSRESLTWRRVATVLVYELPLIAGCAALGALGCHAAGVEGSPALVVIGVIANKGPAVLDPVIDAAIDALKAALRRPR
ncbi:hypothetical protein [Falsiroseomonas sp. CW058]|uniref:hypothetical protein n=1 Tax=Falsiroseomonas sp. CW058 TaxID=3388664 RepID=UPI003D319FA4